MASWQGSSRSAPSTPSAFYPPPSAPSAPAYLDSAQAHAVAISPPPPSQSYAPEPQPQYAPPPQPYGYSPQQPYVPSSEQHQQQPYKFAQQPQQHHPQPLAVDYHPPLPPGTYLQPEPLHPPLQYSSLQPPSLHPSLQHPSPYALHAPFAPQLSYAPPSPPYDPGAPVRGVVRGGRCCCACLPRGYLGAPAAMVFAVIAAVLSIVSACGTGDIFWAGWEVKSKTLYRLTLREETQCDAAAGDTFCTAFFADHVVALSSLPGSTALLAAAPLVQALFAGSAVFAAAAVLRAAIAACRGGCGARGSSALGGGAGVLLATALLAAAGVDSSSSSGSAVDTGADAHLRARSDARWARSATIAAGLHAAAAGACAAALWRYAQAASAFFAANGSPAYSLMGGWSCGVAAAVLHALAAGVWVHARVRGKAAAAAAEGGE